MDILEFNINYQLILSVIGTILAVLLVFLILQFFWLRAKVNRLYRKHLPATPDRKHFYLCSLLYSGNGIPH